jgi:hypothetical protein
VIDKKVSKGMGIWVSKFFVLLLPKSPFFQKLKPNKKGYLCSQGTFAVLFAPGRDGQEGGIHDDAPLL